MWPKEEKKEITHRKTHFIAKGLWVQLFFILLWLQTSQSAWWQAGRRTSRRAKNGPDSSREGCHVAADVQGTQMGTPGKLGGWCKRPRASHPYLCCECCSRTGCGTCSEQIQASSKSTEGDQHKDANPGEGEG